ncbi:DUF3472 domain-containing protein [Flammeovirga agarivorans]|uniref:DUF3472 domain-containing protein n=1 Tax=Flammeovirga agarivorans TaxID=2726742 RepID=A0A7X8SK38_9BACT|nr:DUF3472 domain-containing protein [Flammeovirga agarivorans]NLR91693.1 DUF3472 domain-containing protein [Flammeovirga agarivorans]
MRKIVYLVSLFSLLFTACETKQAGTPIELSIAENAWLDVAKGRLTGIDTAGINEWDGQENLDVYFFAEKSGTIKLKMKGSAPQGTSLEVALGDTEKTGQLKGKKSEVLLGTYEIQKEGYQCITIKNTSKKPVNITSLEVVPLSENTFYSIPKDNPYFGRRGPSVHLNYQLPAEAKDKDIQWYYSEIEVPEGQDALGSYFMANGFGEGYFGIQVNSETERRILFSVWSPYQTDNPNEIPEDQRIQLMSKGSGVHTGKFGDEGSGGQSYKVFPWKAGVPYKFLLKGEPVDATHTQYTAYFYAPEKGQWDLIASFKRPKTHTYLKRFHSFLENFIPEYGTEQRMALYKNQWVGDKEGKWYPIESAKFSADATARGLHRFDYEGGVTKNEFYLENCGFFNNETAVGTEFKKTKPSTLELDVMNIEKVAMKESRSNTKQRL